MLRGMGEQTSGVWQHTGTGPLSDDRSGYRRTASGGHIPRAADRH